MKKSCIAIGFALFTAHAAAAQSVVAFWDLNDTGGSFVTSDFPMPADSGDQSVSALFTLGGAFTTTPPESDQYSYLNSFGGSSVNSQGGSGTNNDIALLNGPAGATNGSFIEFSFDATQLSEVVLSFAARRSPTGFSSVSIDAYDGSTPLGNIASDQSWTGSFRLYSFTTALLDGVSDARIRLTFDGGALDSAAGNNRFDNILIEAVVIPLPGAAGMALAGIGLCALRRRR
jgi:hypothetical protein